MKDGQKQNIDGNNNQQAGGDIVNIANTYVNDSNFITRKLPSSIALVIPKLSKAIEELDLVKGSRKKVNVYDISHKIDFNNLKMYKPLVEKYGYYRTAVESAYDVLDSEDPGVKNRILRFVNLQYDLQRSEILSKYDKGKDTMEIIRDNSDQIMDNVRETIKKIVTSTETPIKDIEELDFCLMTVVCHAFIGCKILEEPK